MIAKKWQNEKKNNIRRIRGIEERHINHSIVQ